MVSGIFDSSFGALVVYISYVLLVLGSGFGT